MKRLIINADDFGFTTGVNSGIIHAHREGVLTSATLMANGDAFDDAVRLARETSSLDVGCHLVLVQGVSLFTGQPFPETIKDLLIVLARKRLDVYQELKLQVEKIVSAGIRPTHLDSHKHTHIVPGVFRAVARLAHEFGIPYVRLPLDTALPLPEFGRTRIRRYYSQLAREYEVRMTDHFVGFRLTGCLDEQSFASALSRVSEGTTEFMCHPGYLDPELLSAATRLKESRVRELEALVSPRIRQLIEQYGLRLSSFAEA